MNVLNPSRILKKREKFFRVWMSDWTGSLQILCIKKIKVILANKIHRKLF